MTRHAGVRRWGAPYFDRSYLWNTSWTFKRRSSHGAKPVGMFAAQAALSIGVGTLVLWVVARGLAAYASFPPLVGGNIAKLSSMLVGSTTSFLLLRTFVFSKTP